jgi:signal peptidase I
MSEDVNNTEVRFGKPAVIQRPLVGALAPDGSDWTGAAEGYPATDDGVAVAGDKPASRASSVLRELVETIVLTLVIFFLVRTVIQNYRIDGISMEPNFHNGQFLIINKLAYRLGEPARGDVIVFHYPRDPSRDFIKRVIGLPGDTVEVRGGQVIVNGETIDEPYDPSPGTYDSDPVTLPEDQLFVMGDNRNNSSDSHIWGALPMENVIGKAVVSYWPPSDWGLVTNEAAADR